MNRPDTAAARPLWLTTLADLGLLLVGFFVFLQASQVDRTALARGFHDAFASADAPIALQRARIDFPTGSAALPPEAEPVMAWVRDAARDRRTQVTVAGASEGPDDVDRATGSAALLAADRGRAVANALLVRGAVQPDQIRIAPSASGGAAVTLDLGFAGRHELAGPPAASTPEVLP